jgi:PAS domain S-box-containing protein
MSDTSRQRRSARPLILGFVVLTVFIAAGGYWAWRLQAQSIRTQAGRSLVAVGDLKAEQISAWLGERRGDAQIIRFDPLISTATADLLAGRSTATAGADLQTVLDAYRRTHGYSDVVMTSPKGAVLLRSPRTASGSLDEQISVLVARATTTGRVETSDLHLDAAGRPRIEFVAPVPSTKRGAPAIAAVALTADPGRSLYPLIRAWPVPSRSGETLLVERRGKRVLYLNELRFRQNTALKLTSSANAPVLPAAMAVRGRRGVVQGVDYRGVPVLAALQPVPGAPWFIVAKEDTNDVLGQARARGWLTAGVTLVLVVLAGAGILFLWRAHESQASAEILENEEKFRTLFENMTEGVALHELVVDTQGAPFDYRILDINPAYEAQIGVTAEQVRGTVSRDAYGVAEPPFLAEYAHTSQTGTPLHFQTYLESSARYFDISVVAQGKGRFATVFQDVTERKQSEKTLRESEDKFKYDFDYSLIGKSITQITGEISVNKAFCDMLGYSPQELRDRTWQEISHPDDIERTQQEIGRLQAGAVDSVRFVKRYLKKGGSVTWADVSTALRRDEDGRPLYFITSVVDITERLAAEEELRASEHKFHETIQALDEGYYSVSLDGVLIDHNPAYARILGMETDADLRGERTPDFWWDPADRTPYVEQLNRDGVIHNYLVRAKTRNGSPLVVLLSAHLVRDEQSEVVRIDGTVVDFTARKAAEEEIERLNAQLEQRVLDRTAQLDATNSELEAFAYSVSHDLRAPLRHISGFSSLLAERVGDGLDEKSRHYVDTISRSVREMGVLIDDLLEFSRAARAELTIEDVDMSAALAEALEPLRHETDDRDIEWSIGPLPAVIADRALLRQVWANLLGNAVKYTRGRAPACIEIGARDGDGAHEVVYWVRDNGVGFDMRYAHKLFGVFQRLHSVTEFEGTGIGLANVQRIINRLGGRVWAEAELDKGATFYFSLPGRKETPS